MKYLLIAALLLAFAAFGKLIGAALVLRGAYAAADELAEGGEGEEQSGDQKWQGKRKLALDEDPDIQGSMHAASEEPTEEA